jgi:hypothetical protein
MAAPKQVSFAERDCFSPQVASPDFATLDEITRSAQHATGASGAALILSDGKIMSCRACSGALVPPVGTALNTETGFTATCVRTAEVVRCDDTETDPRVDGSSCVELGIRSILAVPILNAPHVAGVLEVLSNRPGNFTDRHATALQLLARLVETLCNYVSRSDVSLDSTIPETKPPSPKPPSNDTVVVDRAELTCLSCRHPNPHDSQFCNRCGVVLFSFLGSQDTTVDPGMSAGTQSNPDEGLQKICKIISGNGGPATWNEISEKLLADQRIVAAQDNPTTAATKELSKGSKDATKTNEAVAGAGRTEAGIKARVGAVRRSLWL